MLIVAITAPRINSFVAILCEIYLNKSHQPQFFVVISVSLFHMIAASNDKKAHLLCFQYEKHISKFLKAKQVGNHITSRAESVTRTGKTSPQLAQRKKVNSMSPSR